jgi:hypothetical protein
MLRSPDAQVHQSKRFEAEVLFLYPDEALTILFTTMLFNGRCLIELRQSPQRGLCSGRDARVHGRCGPCCAAPKDYLGRSIRHLQLARYKRPH